MRKIVERIIEYILGNKLCFNLLRFINKKKLIIIYYHRVIKKEDLVNISAKENCVEIESFEKQIKFISHFYNPMSEKDITLAMEGKGKIPEYPVWLTFDDGYKDNYENAYPIFKKYKVPATFFITTGFINKQIIPCDYNIHMKDNNIKKNIHLKEQIDSFKIPLGDISDIFMSWDEIQEMSNNGFSIGAHTITHKILSTLSKEEIIKEILESKNELEKKLGVTVFSFAYPRGKKTDFNFETMFPILQSCGFKLGVTTIGGYNNWVLDKNCFNLKRMGVGYEDTLNFFKVKVSTGSFWQL